MQKTKTKLNGLIISFICVAIIVLGVFTAFLVRDLRLSNAIKKMDINSKETVTRVIKLCKNDVNILTDIAGQYIKKGTHEGAGILMHILQNIDCQNENAKALLKEYCKDADPTFLSQIDSAQLLDTEFDAITECDGVQYGGVDGIYCSDFEGLISFKISGARAKSMSAFDKGVYILDFADNCVKMLSYDGKDSKLILTNTAEFVYCEGFVYSIDLNGNLHSPNEQIKAKEGEVFANLRVANGIIIYNIYNSKRELIDTLTLN